MPPLSFRSYKQYNPYTRSNRLSLRSPVCVLCPLCAVFVSFVLLFFISFNFYPRHKMRCCSDYPYARVVLFSYSVVFSPLADLSAALVHRFQSISTIIGQLSLLTPRTFFQFRCIAEISIVVATFDFRSSYLIFSIEWFTVKCVPFDRRPIREERGETERKCQRLMISIELCCCMFCIRFRIFR